MTLKFWNQICFRELIWSLLLLLVLNTGSTWSFKCDATVRSCSYQDPKCLYSGYNIQTEVKDRLISVDTKIPGNSSLVKNLYDGNLSTSFDTGIKPSAGKPVVLAVDLKKEFYLTAVRLAVTRRTGGEQKTSTFRVIVGQRDQRPCTAAELTGRGVENLIVNFKAPVKTRFVRIENVDNFFTTSYDEIFILGSLEKVLPEVANFVRYENSIKTEMGESKTSLSGLRLEGEDPQFAFRHFWVSTSDEGAIIVQGRTSPAAYRVDSIPNRCLNGYGVALPETSQGNRRFTFRWVNGLSVLRVSLHLINLGLNNTDGATEVEAKLAGYKQDKELYTSPPIKLNYGNLTAGSNPCNSPGQFLYLDTPKGADRIDLIVSHSKGGRKFGSSSEPVVISDLTYQLANAEAIGIVAKGTHPPSQTECINSQLIDLKNVSGSEIRLPNVVVSVSRGFSGDSIILVQQGKEPAAYTENSIPNNCLGGAGVGLNRNSKQPRIFKFSFGDKLVSQFNLVLVVGDENPSKEENFSAQLIGWLDGKKVRLSSIIDIDLKNRKKSGKCEKDVRYPMTLHLPSGFNEVELITTTKRNDKSFGSQLPLALSDVCYTITGKQTKTSAPTPAPQILKESKPFVPSGLCLSAELGEHSFDPTGLPVEGDTSLPFRYLYLNTSTSSAVIVRSGSFPAAYLVKGVPNDCLKGWGIGVEYSQTPRVNQGFTFNLISGHWVKHFGLNLINLGNENTDRAKVVRARMVGSRGGIVRSITPTQTVSYSSNRVGTWNACTNKNGQSFYLDPGPDAFDQIDLIFERSIDGVNFLPGTSENIVITDICYSLTEPFEVPPSVSENLFPTRPLNVLQPSPTEPEGAVCLGTELQERTTDPVGKPVSGPSAYAFYHLWVTPIATKAIKPLRNTNYPIAVRKGSQPALYTLFNTPNECMRGLGIGYLPDKDLIVEGFEFKVINGRAFSTFSFQLISFEKKPFKVRVRGTQNGAEVQQQLLDIKPVEHLSTSNVCLKSSTFISLKNFVGFDTIEVRFEPFEEGSPLLVNQVYLSSLCYTVLRG